MNHRALAARGDSLQHLRRRVAASISRLFALLLLQRLLRLEDLKNKAKLEGASMNIFSTRSTTSPSQAKMERNH